MHYLVIEAHRSEFPHPISFAKDTLLTVGEVYAGNEGWENWYFCEVPGQSGGWVPGQLICLLEPGRGVAVEDYTARELDVDPGQVVSGEICLNGWLWCSCIEDGATRAGWVPLRNLQPGET